jgi:hypothetical protein
MIDDDDDDDDDVVDDDGPVDPDDAGHSSNSVFDAALMEGFSPFLSQRESLTKRVLRAAIWFATVTEPARQPKDRSPSSSADPA